MTQWGSQNKAITIIAKFNRSNMWVGHSNWQRRCGIYAMQNVNQPWTSLNLGYEKCVEHSPYNALVAFSVWHAMKFGFIYKTKSKFCWDFFSASAIESFECRVVFVLYYSIEIWLKFQKIEIKIGTFCELYLLFIHVKQWSISYCVF